MPIIFFCEEKNMKHKKNKNIVFIYANRLRQWCNISQRKKTKPKQMIMKTNQNHNNMKHNNLTPDQTDTVLEILLGVVTAVLILLGGKKG